jgi:uncharacterized protein with beta-barrel porin domain
VPASFSLWAPGSRGCARAALGCPHNLFGRAAWAPDWVSDPSLSPTFLGLPTASFVVNGATPPSNLGLLTAGVEYRWLNGFSLMGRFDSELANGSHT